MGTARHSGYAWECVDNVKTALRTATARVINFDLIVWQCQAFPLEIYEGRYTEGGREVGRGIEITPVYQ